jgi:hypothetical protein
MSSFSNFAVYGISENSNSELVQKYNDQKSFENNFSSKTSKLFTIQLNENISISSNGEKLKPQSHYFDLKNIETSVEYKLTLSDKVNIISDNLPKYDFLILVKQNHDKQTIMERIFQNDRKNLNKFSYIQNILEQDFLTKVNLDDINLINEIEIPVFNFDMYPELNSNLLYILDFNFANSFETLDVQIQFDNEIVDNLQNNVNNPTIVYLLIPFAGIVLILSENPRIKNLKNSNIRALPLLIILIASLGITPLSISSSYYGPQFAFADNSTEIIIDDALNESYETISSNITSALQDSLETPSASIFIEESTNVNTDSLSISDKISFTLSHSIQELISDTIYTDSLSISDKISFITPEIILETFEAVPIVTQPENDNLNTDSLSISDKISFVLNGLIHNFIVTQPENDNLNTDSLSISDKISFVLNGLIHNPTVSPIPIKPINTDSLSISDKISFILTQSIPGAIFSLELASSQTNSIQNDNNQTSTDIIDLDGTNDFIQISNFTSVDTISNLTITSWVSPDYSKGSAEFSVISKENLFKLSINNKINPQQIAKFSIFDGITWTDVESTAPINEKWTHLGATFNGTTMQLYVDGNLSSTTQMSGQLELDVHGKLVTTTIDEISSEDDIVVGASINSKKQFDKISNQFSGQIDDVSLFDMQLDDKQIKYLYKEKQNH